MSSGLMSCVRENSPPIEMAGNDSGAFSLPTVDGSTSPSNAPSNEQQKRRRFHPLRNLRRIFRRRTLTSVDLSSPSSSTVVETNQLSASSPSSPLQHQQQQQQQQQQNHPSIEQHLTKNRPTVVGNTLSVPAHGYAGMSTSTSLPTSPLSLSTSPAALITGSQSCATNKAASANSAYNYTHHTDVNGAMSLSTSVHHQQYSTSTTAPTTGRNLGSCGGVGVLPGAFTGRPSLSGGYFAKDTKPTTVGLIARDTKLKSIGAESINDLENNREMTDSQRSLSEGRLVDSDFSRDGLSQSHDSVFSESATASSLSIVLKAELADVLRKRRNRPDASDEDLGLPRSPTTPQRREITQTTNQSEVSSLSLLSMSSTTDFDDELPSSTANHSVDLSSGVDRTSSSVSSKFSLDNSRSEDVELFSSNWTRLSHSAAKHKMAVRPVKKKGPTRHRRTLESSVLPSTPEVNEDLSKVLGASMEVKNFSTDKAKSRSLPPGVNAKILEQHSTDVKQTVSIKRSKTEKAPSPNSTYAMRSNATKSFIFESSDAHSSSAAADNKDEESSFLRRFVYRNSKRGASKSTSNAEADDLDSQPESKKCNPLSESQKTVEKSADYSQKIEETRKEICREILSEGKSALSAMLNTFILSPESEKMRPHSSNENVSIAPGNKPKSGPAARQRYIPKDLPQPQQMDIDVSSKSPRTTAESYDRNDSPMKDESQKGKTTVPKISKSYTEESFQSISTIRDIMREPHRDHFEKKAKIVGLSAFQQKISRSNDSFNNTFSTDNVEMLLGSDSKKRGKSVEKSKSFRAYTESKEEKEGSLKTQMPSLPDLSQKKDDDFSDDKHRDLALGFEINDNNLVKQKPTDLPLTQGIYTKNVILTTSKTMAPRITTKSPLFGTSASKNISEIEENIDKLVKSPFVSVLRKSATISDTMAPKLAPNVTISAMPTKGVEILTKVENKVEVDKDVTVSPITQTPSSVTLVLAPAPAATPTPTSTTPTAINKVQMREKSIMSTEIDRKSHCELSSSPQIIASGKSNSFNRSRRSSSVIESTENDKGIPEFLKIQLNRVDPTRSKNNVVLSKNARESIEDLTRRFSNESVEITEVKPSTPEEEKSLPSVGGESRTSLRSDDTPPKSPVKKTPDGDNNILRSSDINTSTAVNSNNMSLHERRKLFLSEDKLKNDRKVEEIKLERKKSMSEEVRKCPVEQEPVVVVLRKKSFGVIQTSTNNNKDDPTPELMKVFARRSLKIKDEDLPESPSKKFTPSMDSDKENQSSSEEKLDKLHSIQQQQNGGPKVDVDVSKNRNSLADFRNNKTQTLNNNGVVPPSKTFLPPIRLSGPFRTSTQGSPGLGKSISLTEASTNNNNSLPNNNNNISKPAERQSLGPVVLSSSVPPTITLVEHNSTLTTITKATTIERSATMASMNRVENEFKGIHQRRAEWEKRAKEALK